MLLVYIVTNYHTMKVLFIVGDKYEDIELLYPFYRVIEEGFTSVIVG